MVPGNFPIGCLPSHLTLFGNTSTLDESGCATELNDFARFHNEFLQFSVLKLSRLNPNITIAYADYYTPVLEMIRNPSDYGESLLHTLSFKDLYISFGTQNQVSTRDRSCVRAAEQEDLTTLTENGSAEREFRSATIRASSSIGTGFISRRQLIKSSPINSSPQSISGRVGSPTTLRFFVTEATWGQDFFFFLVTSLRA